MKTKLPLALSILGALLLLLSFGWALVFPAEKMWTEEKSEMVSHLSTEVQQLHMKVTLGERDASVYGDSDPNEVKQQYEATKEKLAAMKAEFERASESPKLIANTLRWVGMLTLVVGLLWMRAGESG